MNKKTIYLAHPLTGHKTKEVYFYYENIKDQLRENYNLLIPLVGKEFLRQEETFAACYDDIEVSTPRAVYGRDTWMVSQSDIVLCDFTDTKIASIGCSFELAIAAREHKHIIIVMTKDNIHWHPFIRETADIIFSNIEDAIDYLNTLAV